MKYALLCLLVALGSCSTASGTPEPRVQEQEQKIVEVPEAPPHIPRAERSADLSVSKRLDRLQEQLDWLDKRLPKEPDHAQ